jgi:AcrR family transcriptional regulator
VDKADGSPPHTLAQEQQRLTRSRIVRAATQVVARRGFDATVDEIARAAEVSTRTVFRHYASHDQLMVATIKEMFEICGRRTEGVPSPRHDVDGWIAGLSHAIHTRNAEIIGEAFWDIHAPNRKGSPVLAEVESLRRESRVRGVRHLAELAWTYAGGDGAPPQDLVMIFALNFSAFTTQALMVDFDMSPSEIGALVARTVTAMLHRAVDAQLPETDADDVVVLSMTS